MRFECTIQQLAGGLWQARHAGSAIGVVEVTAASRQDALQKLRSELQYRMELCPCSGASEDQAELVVRN